MEASEKSPKIEEMITAITGKDRKEVIANGLCMTCDQKASRFRDRESYREYLISGMCQTCQDEVFGK